VELLHRLSGLSSLSLPPLDRRGGVGRFGEAPLDVGMMRKTMRGATEPATLTWFWSLWLVMSILALPYVGAGMPSLLPDGTLERDPWTAGYMPAWTFRFAMVLVAMTAVTLSAIWIWRGPAATRESDGAAAELTPMTVEMQAAAVEVATAADD